MLAQLPQYLITLLARGRREVIVAHGDDARYDGDNLSEVFVESGGGRWCADAG
jgi:hypothetical protein